MWKIVIIDDDFQVVSGLRKAIPWAELDAEFAGEAIDGEAGLKMIEEVNPDIVLTDIYMPVMNGIQMIEELKLRNFGGRFVILSGYNDFEYARTALRLGVDDYLTKPVTLDQIHSVLLSAIEKLEDSYLNRLGNHQVSSAAGGGAREQTREELLLAMLNGWNVTGDIPASMLQDTTCKNRILVMEVLWNERTRNLSLADWNLFKFAVSNIVAEVLGEQWPDAVFVWLFGNHAALLLPSQEDESEEENSQNAERLGRLIIDNVRTFLGLETRMGLGRIKRGWEGIKVSADEAMQKLLETAQLGAGGRMGPDNDGPGIAKAQLPPIQEKHRKAVQFMIDYIHKHYAEDLTLEQLASQLYISKNYLNQLFKKVTGETFTNYVIRVRIERAKALLLEGNHLIYEVSEMVGYQNVPYFSTLFKKYCGVSPSEMMKFRS